MSLIEVVDSYGNPTGQLATREECLQKGLLKRSASVVFICKNRWILLQKRAQQKSLCPWMWDLLTAAGHTDIGELPKDTAMRETKEELWVELFPEDIFFQAMIADNMNFPDGRIQNELGYVYFTDWTNKDDKYFTLQYNEVECLEWFSFDLLEKKISQLEWPTDFVPHKRMFPGILGFARNFIINN